ncbi:geranyltranstransferase [Chytridium lagenaria]|nr:geranyltranstransferase [Chytridium lagenaria]
MLASAAMETVTDKPGYNETEHFVATFDVLVEETLQDIESFNLPQNGKDWIKKVWFLIIFSGKMNRGLTVVSSLKSLKKRDLTEVELRQAEVLGWCVELLQGFFLIADDIMDGSKTRRGAPCWYKADGVGMVAINDGLLLNDVDLSRFSITKHAYIVEYKTAYYSFYLPVALAMRLAGVSSEAAYKQALEILIPLGEYFQIQDDYLDCYGKPEQIGKIGTDIEDNKCSWLINQALSKASAEQRVLLDSNYGQKDAAKVEIVKNVFRELQLEALYKTYEEESYNRLHGLISKLDNSLPQEMFVTFLKRIYKRSK